MELVIPKVVLEQYLVMVNHQVIIVVVQVELIRGGIYVANGKMDRVKQN